MAPERQNKRFILLFLTLCALLINLGTKASGCKESYFGYNCLYRNEFVYKNYAIPELADNRYDTCVPEATSITITFISTRVLFIRLIVKDNTKYKNIGFTFQTKDLCKSCNGSFLLTDSNIVEYHCACLVKADGVTIENIGGKPVCHIEVTEGRNLVAQSTIEAIPVSPEMPYYSFHGLTDEKTDTSKKSCYLTILPGHLNNVTTIFYSPVFVNVIELYDMSPDFHSLNNAELSILDKTDNLVWTLKITGGQERRRFINDKPDVAVHTINIQKFRFIAICEIRFFGDCPAGKYGLNCTENCQQGCASESCDITGRCKFGCIHGFYKEDCSMECNENCGQDGSCDINGICSFGCQTGYYGDRCTEMRVDFRTILDLSQARYKSDVCKQGLVETIEMYSFAVKVIVSRISLTRRNLLGFEILYKSSLYFKPLCSIQLNSACGVSQMRRECYCKNNTNGALEIILNKTAEIRESEALIRVSSFVCGIWNYSNNVSLPTIYGNEVAKLYVGFFQLDLAKCRVTLKHMDILRFCVQNLVSYSMALTFSYSRSMSSVDCVEHFFEYQPLSMSRYFNVSYQEHVGCMRSKSYKCQWYYIQEMKSTNGLPTKSVMSFAWFFSLMICIEKLFLNKFVLIEETF